MPKTLKEFETFYNDPKNWRPPSLSAIAKFMGYRSKGSARKLVQRTAGLTHRHDTKAPNTTKTKTNVLHNRQDTLRQTRSTVC